MPNLPWPSRRDASETGDPSLAALLAWAQFPESSAPEMRPVGEILAALTAGPTDDELAGQAAVLTAYRNRPGVARPAPRAHRRRRRPLFPALSAKAASTAAAAVLGLAAFATAAYAGALHAPVQRLAHVIIGAPAVQGGLTTGSSRGSTNGATSPNGATSRPTGASPTGRAHPSPTPHATAHPSTQPTPQSTGQPSTQPTPQDSGTPTPSHSHKPHPTPHSSGKPTHPPHGNG